MIRPARVSPVGDRVFVSKTFIALATYQGAAYLRQQIQSIRRQSHVDWTLVAHDDGSTDSTCSILAEFAARDERIRLLPHDGRRLGSAGNFGLVMQHAYRMGAETLFLADQDDVWQADKLQRQIELLRQGEKPAGRPMAHLVYSDLVVVNERMQTVHSSFLRSSRLHQGGEQPLRTLLGRSFVLGCACAMNRPLLELALPLPDSIASHDWWTALCAAATGRLSYLPQPTLWYRRHASNASGPAGFWAGFDPRRYSCAGAWKPAFAAFASRWPRQSPCATGWTSAG